MTIFKRELAEYFYTPIAYVFVVIFLVLSGIFMFYVGGFFDRAQADLETFFGYHPWVFLIFTPALGMRLWSEERKTGTLQLLLTLPVSVTEAVVGKFLAAWLFVAFTLLLTVPVWFTVNFLGDPDNGVIIASYCASLLLAAAFLAISSCMSAVTENQVIAFVLALIVNLLFVFGGLTFVQSLLVEWLPPLLTESLTLMSFLSHHEAMTKGVISLANLTLFASTTVLFLYLNTLVIEYRK